MGETCCCTATCCAPPPAITPTSTKLSPKDILGSCKVRWGIGRGSYTVAPGLYAIGSPGPEAPVLVSANYKLTFDALRKELTGLSCYLLILDTKGVNVWCAAGKGTFGTEELVSRVALTGLADVVTHRTLTLPQLGAVGVSAHQVKALSGFTVEYGPVRANDIRAYLEANHQATPEMRRVTFTVKDRLVLTPMELVLAVQKALPILGCLLVTNQFAAQPFDKHDLAAFGGAVAAGTVVTPVLLPYLPGRAFACKGFLAGLGWTAKYLLLTKGFQKGRRLKSTGELLLLPAVSSYLAMNFTGSSTYTSPSGVNKEMKKALPWIVGAAALGGALTLGAHFGRRKP